MMKLLPLSCILIFVFTIHSVQAQKRNITGKVTTAEHGLALPGVNIIIKGTTTGTLTDLEGRYTLEIPTSDVTLTFSFIGMIPVDVPVGTSNVIDVQMVENTKELGEFIVTAFGIEKVERSIGYSVAQINANELTKGQERSVLNALQGKVAGVNITSNSGAPGASSRMIIRGISTLAQTNQPLYVIDGVPVNNSSINNGTNSGAVTDRIDLGNRMNDISPEDIESVSILKTGATALYGSRGANGVVLVTTKSGKRAAAMGKPEITFNTSLTFNTPLKLPDFQNEYGQGTKGGANLIENLSWGPKFDGESRVWGHIVDNQQRMKPYVALPNNIKDFFDIGTTYNSSIALAGGNEQSHYRISYGNVHADGFMPTDADSYIRHTLAVRGGAKIGNKITSTASLNYVKKDGSYVPTGEKQSTLDYLYQTPRDISVVEHEDYNNKFNNLNNYYTRYNLNPYYVLNEHGNAYSENRVYGNVQFGYTFNPHLSATWRVGSDISNTEVKRWRAITLPQGYNTGTSHTDKGSVTEDTYIQREINSDFILRYVRDITENISLDALVGQSINQRSGSNLNVTVADLDIPGFYDISNSSGIPSVSKDEMKRRSYGIFSQITLGYKDYLFVNLSARNDWSSTLPEKNNSYFYPGINTSFIFTDAIADLPDILSYGKLRAAWTQTGADIEPYKLKTVFIQGTHTDGFGELTYPLEGSINGFEVSNLVGNPNLHPEITTEIELGMDLGLLSERINLGITYYVKKKTDLFSIANVSPSSGVTQQGVNLGEITNKGWEILLNTNPIRTPDFSWDFSLNFSNNKNELTELNEILDGVPAQIWRLNNLNYIAKEGQPIGLFEGNVVQRTPEGKIVVGSNGLPLTASEKEIYGDANYDYMMGISNTLNYKGLSLSALFDIRQGGLMYSRTARVAYFTGSAPETLYNDRQPFVIPNSVQKIGETGDGSPIYEDNTVPIAYETNLETYWGNGGTALDRKFLLDRSFVKLRELSLSYTLPQHLIENLPFQEIKVGFVGRNLLLWVPKENTFLDPEMTTFGNDIEADFGEFSATPTAKSMGFNLRIRF